MENLVHSFAPGYSSVLDSVSEENDGKVPVHVEMAKSIFLGPIVDVSLREVDVAEENWLGEAGFDKGLGMVY